MFRLFFIFLLAGSTLGACHHKSIPVITEENPPEKILFITYEVLRDSASGKIAIKVLAQALADGMVKQGSIENQPDSPGNWQITISDIKDKPLETIRIENPLHQKLEYVGEDGKLGVKDVWLKRAEIAVRTNYKKAMKQVSVEEIVATKNNRLLLSHPIQLPDK